MFVHLHVHSCFSLLEGCFSIPQLLFRLEELQMPVIALTDTNAFYGAIHFYQWAKQVNVKPVVGCCLQSEDGEAVLLAKDREGFSQISKIITARHLVEHNQSYTLFATHYFELTRLAEEYRDVANIHVSAVEHKDRIVFLHAVEEGPASQSYGIQVAQLAGIPPAVVRAARKHLAKLEEEAASRSPQGDLFAVKSNKQEPPVHPALEALRELEPDSLSPKEALDLVYRLKKLLD